LESLPVLPVARRSEKFSPAHVQIADMLPGLAIKNAKTVIRHFSAFSEPA